MKADYASRIPAPRLLLGKTIFAGTSPALTAEEPHDGTDRDDGRAE
jgi:hypothetical protein